MHVPLDDIDDADIWGYWAAGPQFGTPLCYRPFLERKPERAAAAVAAVARARPGGVVVHCGGGRDRTGLISLLLLALVGVAPDDIATNYELSSERLRSRLLGPPVAWCTRSRHERRGAAILDRSDTIRVAPE